MLLGVTTEPKRGVNDVDQFVIDPLFAEAAMGTGKQVEDPESLILLLVEQAEEESRRIIAWSEHDLSAVRKFCSPATTSRFAARYRNGRAFAEKWRKELRRDNVFGLEGLKENALANYMRLIDYQVPEEFGLGRTGKNIGRLTRPMEIEKRWDALTERQQSYWTEILGHNAHDCVGMYEVCLLAATEPEAAGVKL